MILINKTMRTLYTVYRTTKTDDGRFYIGVHKTIDPNDNYLGSGVHLRAAVKKYGRAFFKKEVLFIFESADEAYSKEKELVNSTTLQNPNILNKTTGGSGGDVDWSKRERKILRGEEHPQFGKKRTDEQRRKTAATLKRTYKEKPRDPTSWQKTAEAKRGVPSPLRGTTQTAESNAKRSKAHLNLTKKICEICGRSISPQNFERHLLTHSV